MEEEKRIRAAAALAAIVGLVFLVVQFSGRPEPKRSGGANWLSRISSFGLTPSADPAPGLPADAAAAPELAPPERMMANAATRSFSNPSSAGSSGGLAGAEPARDSASNAPMNASHLASGGSGMDFPSGGGGGRSPTSGGASPPMQADPGGGARAPAQPGASRPAAAESQGTRKRPIVVEQAPGGGVQSRGTTGDGGIAAAPTAGVGTAPGAGSTPGSGSGKSLNDLSGGAPGGGGLGGGAGGGGGGGSGGGGSGGGGGGGGGAIDAKPKESAGPPDGGSSKGGPSATAAGPSAGSAGPRSGAINGNAPPTPDPTAMAGAPDAGVGVPSGKTFTLKSGAVIETEIFTKNGTKLVGFTAPMAIDGDGPNGAAAGDKTYQRATSLRYTPGGESIDARVVPFVVISQDFPTKHPEVKLGDYASVTYGGKTLYGIVADVGPRLGEASPAMAKGFPGINPDPVRGGLEAATVRYLIAPGSGSKFKIPRQSADVQKNGRAIFDAAGATLK